jgi:iron complex outermembrane receptor protein
MKRTLVLIILFCCQIFLPAFAAGIKGKITDKITGEPLTSAHILLPKFKKATVSGPDGSFEIDNVVLGKHRLEISYLGYESLVTWLEVDQEQNYEVSIQLQPTIYSSDEVVITASRSNENIRKIPARVNIISRDEIMENPHQRIEDILKYSTGVNVLSPTGLYSMRPVVTLRGLGGDEQGRTLVLVDGIPLNKGDTGGVNWSRINADDVERIEVFHGPGSSIYGNNAMGGVINIITRKPTEPVEGSVNLSYGTYNTLLTSANIGGTSKNGMYFRVSGMYNTSDGYNDLPEEFREEPDYSVARFLNEYNITTKAGWAVDPLFNAEIQYDHYRNKKGEGEKIEAPDGEYRKFDTDFLGIRINGNSDNFSYNLNAYYQIEGYFKLDERMRNGTYSRFDVKSDRIDKGLSLNLTNTLTSTNKLIYGAEARYGSVEGGDYYTTSPDSIVNKGKMDNYAVFVQDEQKLLQDKVTLTVGLRYDLARFHDGDYITTDDSWTDILPALNDHEWSAISPRVGINYQPTGKTRIYASWSKGFRASILDDLCRSGWMWVGPKIANPELGPESINNFEIGGDIAFGDRISVKPSLFYSKGKDFLYYVATGDSLWGKRPVYQRQNITEVEIYGLDLNTNFKVNDGINVFANYTFNHSEIGKFDKTPELEGKTLKYTPMHQLKAGLFLQHRWIDFSLAGNYKSKQYTNDDNSNSLDPYISFDTKIMKNFGEKITAWIEILDITDNQHNDTEYYLSPGRRISIGCSVSF